VEEQVGYKKEGGLRRPMEIVEKETMEAEGRQILVH
jgi:hypothetical protein